MYRANQAFGYVDRKTGFRYLVAKGDIFADNDPILKGRSALFDEVVVTRSTKKSDAKKPAKAPAAG